VIAADFAAVVGDTVFGSLVLNKVYLEQPGTVHGCTSG
jgi:hypothetical protein